MNNRQIIFTQEQINEIITLYNDGLNPTQIGNKFNLSLNLSSVVISKFNSLAINFAVS